MLLGEHPLFVYHGMHTWPPVWTWIDGGDNKRPRGEVGILKRVEKSHVLPVIDASFILITKTRHTSAAFCAEFSEESRMYAVLKNGLVLHHFETGNESRTVEILCDKFHARMILAAAEMYCHEAVSEIEEAIRLSRSLH